MAKSCCDYSDKQRDEGDINYRGNRPYQNNQKQSDDCDCRPKIKHSLKKRLHYYIL